MTCHPPTSPVTPAPAGGGPERRKRIRFGIRRRVSLHRIGEGTLPVAAETLNVSSSGVLLASGVQLTVGSTVGLEMGLFSDVSAGVKVRLECRATVVRSEMVNAGTGAFGWLYRAGLQFLEYQFVRQRICSRRRERSET